VRTVCWYKSCGRVRKSWNLQIPALETKTFRAPNLETVEAMRMREVSGREMSPGMARKEFGRALSIWSRREAMRVSCDASR